MKSFKPKNSFMGKSIQIKIPQPCHENWAEMTPAEKGRFCASCQKTVFDFTALNDRQLMEVLKNQKQGSHCGRFRAEQLNRTLEAPRHGLPWLRYFFTVAIPAFLAGREAKAQGAFMVKAPVETYKKMSSDMDTSKPSETTKKIRLTGRVLDHQNNPYPGASVLVSGTTIGIVADPAGCFKLDLPAQHEQILELSFSAIGYMTKNVPIRFSSQTEISIGDIVFEEADVALKGEIVIMMGVYGAVSPKPVKRDSIDIISMSENNPDLQLKVYPNPISVGSIFKVDLPDSLRGDFYYELTSLDGRRVLSGQRGNDKVTGPLSLQMPLTASGYYLLRIRERKGNKNWESRVLVQ
jgi:hypothetical protein